MRKLFLVLSVVTLCTAASQAQMRKCTDAGGKVTYSDVLCASDKKETDVKGNVSSVDTSGLRREAAGNKNAQTAANRPKSVYERSRARFDKCNPAEGAIRYGDTSSPGAKAAYNQYVACRNAAAKENY